MNIQNQKGVALPLVMIAILLGALLVPPFLTYTGTGLIGSRYYGYNMDVQYALDAGAEHAIWNLLYGGLADLIMEAGDSITYDLAETINGENVTVLVSNSYNVLAWDNFEGGSSNWGYGEGWLRDWARYGTPEITSLDSPKEGTYHLRMNITDSVTRSVDLSDALYASARFWYRQTTNFDGGAGADYAYFEVSSDGVNFVTARRWSSADNSAYGTYRFVTIPLSDYGMSDNFTIRFRADTDSGENFYIDDLDIVWMATPVQTIAEDDFENGDWTGGYGWFNELPWTVTGNAKVNSGVWIWPQWFGPHGGTYQAQLRGGTSYTRGVISRPVDLSGQSVVHVQFWGRQDNFGNTDRMYLQVSSNNGSSWTTAATFGRRASSGVLRIDNTWRYYDIDISGYSLTAGFWIRFNSNCTNTSDYMWIDDLRLNTEQAFCIVVTVGDRVLEVTVDTTSGGAEIVSWVYIT